MSPWLGQFLRLSLSLMTQIVLRNSSLVFCRSSPNLGWSGIFLMVALGLWVWGGRHRFKVSPLWGATGCQQDVSLLTLSLTTCPRPCVLAFCNVSYFSPTGFQTLLFGSKHRIFLSKENDLMKGLFWNEIPSMADVLDILTLHRAYPGLDASHVSWLLILTLTPFYRGGNWGTKRVNNLS